ncbi:tetratricopeptide repeat protein [Ancylomarina sp. DW003]|nr:tetratricopeptide repeat protein [Ancylomarina sp. DW003]MDE5423248.1 tetratricopeptide repeat protein [Ancylomarina sp. DW003]
MKTRLTILTAVLMLSTMFGVNAQTKESKYGVDSAKTILSASLYGEMVKQKNYKEALPGWRYVFNNAPKFQRSTYTNGVKIMRGMLYATKDKKYVDTLMMVYDQRIKYFGTNRKYPTGWIMGRKGGDLFTFKKKDMASVKEAYGIMQKSIEMRGVDAEEAVVNKTMEAGKLLVMAGELAPELLINDYLAFMDLLKARMAKYPKKANNVKGAIANVENDFFAAGVADCETLSNIFTPKFEANPEDMVLINKIMKMLNRQECEDGALYAKVAEQKYKLEPSADAAHNLAKMFIKKKQFSKSKEYLQKSIDLEEDAEIKADLYFKLASINFMNFKLTSARKNARAAIKNMPNWGQPYILIGKCYAASSKTFPGKAYEKQAVYWVAVDKFKKAKSVDPECAVDANKWIKTYSKYFPRKEEAFMQGLKEGESYKVGGWINETTKIRLNE